MIEAVYWIWYLFKLKIKSVKKESRQISSKSNHVQNQNFQIKSLKKSLKSKSIENFLKSKSNPNQIQINSIFFVFLPSGRDGFEGMGVMFNEHKDIKYFGLVLFLFADKNSTALLNAQALDVS